MLTSGAAHSSRFLTYAGDAFILHSARTTLHDKSTFLTRVLPSIASVSYNEGSPSGGHLLTVTGHAWVEDQSQVSITIDGPTSATSTACAIEQFTKSDVTDLYTATCRTAASAATTGSVFPGGHGWKATKYNGKNGRSDVDLTPSTGDTPDQTYLAFNAESVYNNYESAGTRFTVRMQTMFKAPVTGDYAFWVMADDSAELYLHRTPNEIPAAMAYDATDLVMTRGYSTIGLHWYDRTGSTFNARSTEVVGLQAGEYYYMEAWHSEGSGDDYMQIGVEYTESGHTK